MLELELHLHTDIVFTCSDLYTSFSIYVAQNVRCPYQLASVMYVILMTYLLNQYIINTI